MGVATPPPIQRCVMKNHPLERTPRDIKLIQIRTLMSGIEHSKQKIQELTASRKVTEEIIDRCKKDIVRYEKKLLKLIP